MSAMGHKRTLLEVCAMSALPPKADIDCLCARALSRGIEISLLQTPLPFHFHFHLLGMMTFHFPSTPL